ncbi:MAG: hypothetical protein A3K06_03295 [Candidatus Doudnabacteria bacterium RIFCSPHIGHO2_01_52_17]|uniref:Cation-transporting P-type ATPase N-terminal domain-containing protein n=1 Tax=Candidatus Doudnabacteria bacterium RIFCSPHIGHO2_01_52_17 TaxID=1817820 RepID=A0A1F5NGB3_9BACT|nr:MAG: hypothetical protein A3K06_03295 [Candidatus Doudnabacteria bacterium RIFCSPHIGHO2_01_52_17]
MQAETKNNNPDLPHWHSIPLDDALRRLSANPNAGLTAGEAANRQKAWGKNVLPKGKTVSALERFLRQFTSPLVYILLFAAALTWWIGEYADMTVILIVVILNAIIGFFQEYRANKIFEKLKAIVRVQALVFRGGKIATMDSQELVPGDLIVIKSGDKVPADARLISVNDLQTDEALLTGESKPVSKILDTAPEKALVGDRHNMVFMGTVVEQGEGRAVVVSTGGRTEIGQISLLTQSADEEDSPLQKRMGKLAKFLTELFVVISAAIFIIGIAEGDPWVEMITTTVAVAVAAIPEGLPAVISIVLAVSSKKILEKKGLVLKLLAAETLGSTAVICTDKTGTLTYGRMKVEELHTKDEGEAELALGLANEAIIEERDGKKVVRGEATDKAKLEKFLGAGLDFEQTLQKMPRVGFLPFHDERKYIASFHQDGKKMRIFVSGAPEYVLRLCDTAEALKKESQKTYESLAARGFRVIGLAAKTVPLPKKREFSTAELLKLVNKLDYVGLAAIRDPIREEVKQTIALTKQAGIRVIMITGDHVLTAKAIGLELGLRTSGKSVLTGEEMDTMSDRELIESLTTLEIIARVNPVHKMRIINAWQKLGAIVAMTGDGVNDAPALKAAEIGVALGSGTDVAKEASDLILLDDGFSTITAAVAEGRTAFANIRKATVVVMSNAFTELVLITSTLIFHTPFPVTAVQILWVNIVEDSLPVLAMAFEPEEEDIMKTRPTSPGEPILDRASKFIIFGVSIVTDLALVGIFLYLYRYSGWEFVKIQTFIFIATATPTLLNIFAFKSLRRPIYRIKLFNNTFLIIAVAAGLALMLMAIYLPFFNRFLKTVPLPVWPALAAFVAFPLLKLLMVELTKWWYRAHAAKT